MLIEARSLSVEINTVPILKEVDLAVTEPGLLAVVGKDHAAARPYGDPAFALPYAFPV